ncbi:Structural maintenance of chromosomes protein 6 [Coccomyxa sp. Obi]|nr:Structural maintenance of chromosomes protein 6 [Coccomyxa sp. Obi]
MRAEKVDDSLVESLPGTSYEDGDEEDVWWEDIFGEEAKVKGLKLPEAAAAQQEELHKKLLARQRPPLKTCNNQTMTPSGLGKRPACQIDGRTTKRRAALDDTALKSGGGRCDLEGDADAQPEDVTPIAEETRWGRRRARKATPPQEEEPEEDTPDATDAAADEEAEREGSPAAELAAQDDTADGDFIEPAPRAGRRRSRSRQPPGAAAAAATQPPPSQALTQRGPSRATQRTLTQLPLRKFTQMVPGGGVGLAGQVASVHAENFMSHKNFSIDFGPHLNFITGENGSGKSATLQCLQVCLGARARETGRAGAARGLINDEASSATARTVLWNTGEDAYQPELYGPTITIIRRLQRSGGSSYYLRPHEQKGPGRQVTKADVDAIVQDHFNIDPSNPIICLTQDSARSFAGTASDEEKYKLYMEATGFDAVMLGLAKSAQEVFEWQERLKAVKDELMSKKERISELEETMQQMAEVDSWQAEVAHLDKCIAWIGVQDARGEIAHRQVQVEEELPREIAEAEAGVQEKAANREAAQADFDAKKAENDGQLAEMRDFTEEQRRLHSQVKRAERDHRKAAQQLQHETGKLDMRIAELDTARRAEDDLQQQHVQATQNEAAESARELQAAEQAADAAAADASCASQAVKEALALKEQSERDMKKRQDDAQHHDRRVRELQSELRSLKASKGDPIAKFGGNNLVRLVEAIDAAMRQGRFTKRPIGPIGAHLSLSDDRWSFAVDTAIGGCFSNFLVHCQRDLTQLLDIAKRLRVQRPAITVYNFDTPMHDLSRKPQLPPDVLTIKQVLCLPEDPNISRVLHNYLLDYEQIERRVLVPDANTGLRMIRETDWFGRAGGRPALANDVWAENAWRGFKRGDSESSMGFNGTKKTRLTKDVQGQVAEMEAELRVAREAHADAQRSIAQARAEVEEAKQNVARLQRERQGADRAHSRTQSQLEDLRASVRAAAVADDPELDKTDEIEKLQEAVDLQRSVVDEKTAARAAAAAVWDEAKAAEKAQADANEAGLQRATETQKALEEAINNLQAAKNAVAEEKTKLQKLQHTQESTRKQLQEILRVVEEISAEAAEVCTEEDALEARRQLKQLWQDTKRARDEAHADELLVRAEMETRMQALKKDITRRERQMGTNLDALKVELERLRDWYDKKHIQYSTSVAAWKRFREAYNKRQKKHEEVRDNVNKELNSQFNRYLKGRNWRGGIKINQEKGTLTILAQQDPNSGRAESDLKVLSGGERSFVTVCYLLALCRKLQSSFHALDEFDVFMDNLNRGRSLMMLMDFAVTQKDTQLILLTPLNTGAINAAAEKTKKELPGGDWPEPDFMRIKLMTPAQRSAMRSQPAPDV